jgi:hypothetical protein
VTKLFITLPYEVFNVEQDLTGRIAQVSSWFRPVTYDTPQFRVKLTYEQWADFMSKDIVRNLLTFFKAHNTEIRPLEPTDGGEYDRWIQIANALFYVEEV